jgi:hypothetical protein
MYCVATLPREASIEELPVRGIFFFFFIHGFSTLQIQHVDGVVL